jgi:hypothetical protein
VSVGYRTRVTRGIVSDIASVSGGSVDKEPTPAQLLASALDALPAGDRTRVLAWLLNRSFPPLPAFGAELAAVAGRTTHVAENLAMMHPSESTTLLTRTLVRRGEHQVVPIRLPAEQHGLLRDWCQEHGFTMATVVRGLVERFLEERGLLSRTHAKED